MIKQVIVIRKDLNMRKGKMVAQGAHASIKALLNACHTSHNRFGSDTFTPDQLANEWLQSLSTKICVGVDSEQQLMDIFRMASDAKLPCSIIKDAGLTEFREPTYTAVGIGPANAEEIDEITKNLPLL